MRITVEDQGSTGLIFMDNVEKRYILVEVLYDYRVFDQVSVIDDVIKVKLLNGKTIKEYRSIITNCIRVVDKDPKVFFTD